jgi:phenylacetate-CoA ligase
MIYDIEYETMPREALEAIQLRRLQTTLERVYANVPFLPSKTSSRPASHRRDIQRLEDYEAGYRSPPSRICGTTIPFNMFAVPMDNVVRIHASSGTTGQPTVVGYTVQGYWVPGRPSWPASLSAGGAGRGDIIHNAYGYGLFTGGLGVHYGAERLGASVIPVSGGNTKRQVVIMKDFGPTILTATPSYALHLAEVAEDMGVSFNSDLSFKFGIFGAEPWSEKMRGEIERKLNLTAVDIYGLSEVMGPGVAIECHEAKQGLHVFEDHFIPEIVDPQHPRAPAIWHHRRTGIYLADQRGLPRHPLPDARHHQPQLPNRASADEPICA